MREENVALHQDNNDNGSGKAVAVAESQTQHHLLDPPVGWEESFAETVGSLWCHSRVPLLEEPPTALQFCRDFVGPSKPCIIRNAILGAAGGRPLHLTLDEICDEILCPQTTLTVDVTPNGHGDCVQTVIDSSNNAELMFVQPKACGMSLGEFRTRLRRQERQFHPEIMNSSTDENAVDVNGLPAVPLISESNDAGDSCDNVSSSHMPLHTKKSTIPLPDNSIVYYSRQNDCLRTPEQPSTTSHPDITDLASLFPATFDWAQQAFGSGDESSLEAVNLWMGNAASVSSMHKDHYENLFYVASGEKVFWVCPPSDVMCLYQDLEYPSGQFENIIVDQQHDDNDTETGDGQPILSSWVVRPDTTMDHGPKGQQDSSNNNPKVRWIYPDVSLLVRQGDSETDKNRLRQQRKLLLESFPLLQYTHPMEIRVQAGEMLYLPSLWFHRVTQTCETVAINYWYDMRFDNQWCYFQLLQECKLVVKVGTRTTSCENKKGDHENEYI